MVKQRGTVRLAVVEGSSKDETRAEDFRAKPVYAAERDGIERRRKVVGPILKPGEAPFADEDLERPELLAKGDAGLAISGGGIRSATFALGLLQALARADVLKGFDYLSTVSGGGYIGSSITWLLRPSRQGAGYGLGPKDFPFGTAKPRDRSDPEHWEGMLRFLREHGNYLAPSREITLLSGIAVVLRGILLNLLVWLPVFTAFFLLLLHGWPLEGWTDVLTWAGITGIPDQPELFRHGEINLHEILVLAGLLAMAVFAAVSVIYSLFTLWAADGAVAKAGYFLRRAFETVCQYLVPGGVVLMLVGLLPYFVGADILHDKFGGGGIGALVTGLGSAVLGARKEVGSKSRAMLLPMGATLILAGLAILACYIAFEVGRGGYFDGWRDHTFLAFLITALVTGYFVNVNFISVHRFYRDRLMEAFMPSDRAIRENSVTWSAEADQTRMHDLWHPAAAGKAGAPYHIVNTNLILVDSAISAYRTRGGDNFVVSPLYCGGDAVGYYPTARFAGGDMTLATAVAISGAAANPNSGWAGTGPTRSKAVSWLMALLNIRLGYWVHNPNLPRPLVGSGKPNHFNVFIAESMPGGFTEKARWLQLSDGGHFENLAIYELVRRRAKLILISDAGADPEFGFGDVQNTVRRVSQDFGATIDFGKPFWTRAAYARTFGISPEKLDEVAEDHRRNRISSLVPRRPTGYPVDGLAAGHGYIVGSILYPAVDDTPQEWGIVIYVKATMIDGLSLETRGYKTDNPEFPHQSTADQFFDEAQFEAYRELGFAIGEDMIRGVRLAALLERVTR